MALRKACSRSPGYKRHPFRWRRAPAIYFAFPFEQALPGACQTVTVFSIGPELARFLAAGYQAQKPFRPGAGREISGVAPTESIGAAALGAASSGFSLRMEALVMLLSAEMPVDAMR